MSKPDVTISRRVVSAPKPGKKTAAQRAETAAARRKSLLERGEANAASRREREAATPPAPPPFKREDVDYVVAEVAGRKIKIGAPSYLSTLRTLEILGDRITAVTETFLVDMMFVREIDGEAMPDIATADQRDAVAMKLGEMGIDAVRVLRAMHFPPLQISEIKVVEKVLRRRD